MTYRLQDDVSLVALNSFGVEARARWYVHVRELAHLQALREDDRVHGQPWLILGGGSNVLFVEDFPGVVAHIDIPGYEDLGLLGEDYLVRVGAGQSWPALVERLVHADRPGLENLALIPGRVGAAPIQNIGAYGLELAERLHSVTVWEADSGQTRELGVEACGLGYRDSVFKRDLAGARVIVAVTLRLPRRWQPVTGYAELDRELATRVQGRVVDPVDVFDAVCALRQRKLPDPASLGNAGSFFKNPIVSRARHAELITHFPSLVSYPLAGGRCKLGAAWLIEACGFKGCTRGKAGVFERQALVLVNRGGAAGREILALAREVQARVLEKFGVALEPEVRIAGALGR
jgi:UDP-N-acetylmuramate dehydrogenase